MGYTQWVERHAKKHKKIVDRLLQKGYDKALIIEYFDFENMCEHEKDFCPLYGEGRKCHDIEALNCYLCACPNFRFSDGGIKELGDKRLYSYCSIDSKDGRQGVYGDKIHQDCSKCGVPHTKEYVKRHFSLDWADIMQKCSI